MPHPESIINSGTPLTVFQANSCLQLPMIGPCTQAWRNRVTVKNPGCTKEPAHHVKHRNRNNEEYQCFPGRNARIA